jgi:hypothetical protein
MVRLSSGPNDMTTKVLVATPAYGGQLFAGYFLSVMKFERACRARGIRVEYQTCSNESLIPRARNTLADTFMNATDFTHLLFIDADIEFDPDDIFRMLDADRPIIGGAYPLKTIDWDAVAAVARANPNASAEALKAASRQSVFIAMPHGGEQERDQGSIVETRYAGTGLLLIQRQVLERMRAAHPDDVYNAKGSMYFRYFDAETKYGVYLSEDYWFCERWREMGGRIHVLTDAKTRHWGTYIF